MELPGFPECHLTYCTNIHPGESWQDVYRQLGTYIPEIKRRVSPDAPFGIGLRLSAEAAYQLRNSGEMNRFRSWLDREGLYVFSINGFPFGHFHQRRVKEQVYEPDWSTRERLDYTDCLIDIMSELISTSSEGSISTSPVSYKYRRDFTGPDQRGNNRKRDQTLNKSAVHFAILAWKMHGIHERHNKEIHLDIEPEPDCLLENSTETIRFFQDVLLSAGGSYLTTHYGLSEEKSREILLRYIRVCFDTCHFALEYEKAPAVISAFNRAGIRIGKTQISCALKVLFPADDPVDADSKDIPALNDAVQSGVTPRRRLASRLRRFNEPTYLHQVIARHTDGSLSQYRDLPPALADSDNAEVKEWRVHLHVPVFHNEPGDLQTTQAETAESMLAILSEGQCRHFEVETYTWGVLPDHLKTDLAASIEREMRWAIETAATAGKKDHQSTRKRDNRA